MTKRSRVLQSPKYLRKKQKKTFVKVFLVSTCVLLSLIIALLIVRASFLQISHIEVQGATSLDPHEIETVALSTLQGNRAYVIPKTSIIFYSASSTEGILRQTFKKIKTISVHRSGLSGLRIVIVERTPQALACSGFRDDPEQETQCSFVDESGYVFAPAPTFSSGPYLHYYLGSNKDFIDPQRFSQLQVFAQGIVKTGVTVLGILIDDGGLYELYIKNQNGSDAILYFDDHTPFDKTLSNFTAFWDSARHKKLGTTTVSNFDYINLRFGNNIFYVAQ